MEKSFREEIKFLLGAVPAKTFSQLLPAVPFDYYLFQTSL
jgi:hypothetical protein